MKYEKILNTIQTKFKISRFELTAILIIILGAVLAIPGGELYKAHKKVESTSPELVQLIEEFANNSKSTYIGSDVSGAADSTLIAGDTIIASESKFPTSSKKLLTDGTKISLNNASKTELMRIPNVGDATANRIIEYRSRNRFKRIQDIMNVKGIGEKKFEKMQKHLSL